MIKHKHLALALSIALAAPACAFTAEPRIFNKAGGTPDLQAEHWYSIRDLGEGESKTIEVFIYGEIGFWGVTSGDFIRDLQAQDDGVSKVLVRFDTIGGDLFDGIAIHNTLRALGERCTARIDGACFSAGSVAACGAHRVEMADNALMMIHNPWTWMAGGSEELRKMADMMDKAREGIIASYQHRALNIDEAELSRMIDEETWLTPAEAKAHGFVDEVLGAGQPLASNAALGKILNRYRNVPEAARQLLATADPEPEPEPPAPEPVPLAPEAAALAAQLATDCAAAGLSACLPALIKASGLKSAEAVQAELTRAKAIHAACVLAKLPSEAPGLIEAGVTADAARLQLWDKLAASSGKVEIDNRPPVDDLPQNTVYQPPVPSDVYSKRRNQASKGGTHA
ncbi:MULTISPECIES: head maturation protease, ClpP-related [unclassified Pseudomonas]|uniref:head maturation protease, ClpP-related n=1 Tax=unclassified Pseudomonas TaxID=196821 RepID=UPI00244B8D4D|nr:MULTISPECIES: head maturation protease, ClpP-related [unclassified Pseudomonas]MDH0894229.1 Clp protease ClpP [Pseudomonas sp. GD03875]MDH1063476.1 Clp protease ClpP [Pseudomonas sp. GD03985]